MRIEQMIEYVRLYTDAHGEWRFTAYAADNEPIVVSSGSYKDKTDALDAATSTFPDVPVREGRWKESRS